MNRPEQGRRDEANHGEEPHEPDPEGSRDLVAREHRPLGKRNAFEQQLADLLDVLGPRLDANVPGLGDPPADLRRHPCGRLGSAGS